MPYLSTRRIVGRTSPSPPIRPCSQLSPVQCGSGTSTNTAIQPGLLPIHYSAPGRRSAPGCGALLQTTSLLLLLKAASLSCCWAPRVCSSHCPDPGIRCCELSATHVILSLLHIWTSAHSIVWPWRRRQGHGRKVILLHSRSSSRYRVIRWRSGQGK